MTHIRMIAKKVADDTGKDFQTAYVATRTALQAIPTPTPGVQWDFYRVPDELVDRVADAARRALEDSSGQLEALAPVERAQKEFADAEKQLERAREKRDESIRAARAAGVPIAALQEVTHLSRQRVSGICRM